MTSVNTDKTDRVDRSLFQADFLVEERNPIKVSDGKKPYNRFKRQQKSIENIENINSLNASLNCENQFFNNTKTMDQRVAVGDLEDRSTVDPPSEIVWAPQSEELSTVFMSNTLNATGPVTQLRETIFRLKHENTRLLYANIKLKQDY